MLSFASSVFKKAPKSSLPKKFKGCRGRGSGSRCHSAPTQRLASYSAFLSSFLMPLQAPCVEGGADGSCLLGELAGP